MVKLVVIVILLSSVLKETNAGPEYDFENGKERFTFKSRHSHTEISNQYHKSGKKSLLWQWSRKTTGGPYAKLVIELRKSLYIKGEELEKGGLKLWLYRQNIILRQPSKMEIVFQGKSIHQQTPPTTVNLDFFGWRSLWIGYREFGDDIKKLGQIEKVKFTITTLHEDDLFFDLVRFVTSVKHQNRDSVLKHVGKKSVSKTEDSFIQQKDEQRSIQQIYKLNVPSINAENTMTKSKEIRRILNRFDNWYALSDKSLSVKPTLHDKMYDSASSKIPFEVYKENRWFKLKQDIKRAHKLYEMIDFENKRPELFPLNSKYGEYNINNSTKGKTKFGFVFNKILLPLSLDYHLMDRRVERRELARLYCTKLESIHYKNRLEATMAIAGDTPLLIKSFLEILHNYQKNNSLDCATYKKGRFKEPENVLHNFNEEIRLKRVIRLLDFIEEQGWSKESGLGSSYKELDHSGSGIIHSIFLLRKALNQKIYKKRLQKLIKTMKWYTDFKEILGKKGNNVYSGGTAERMSTLLLHRLMIILVNPNPKQQAKELKQFCKWFKSNLKINHGLGGIIQPDYTSFHHNTFYGSKYVPEALHHAAFVQYLLEGTQFAFDKTSKENLRGALEVLRLVSVKYSTPNSINGAYPGYHRSILAEILPAYAYISFRQPTNSPTSTATKRDMLMRLLDPQEPAVNNYLKNGHVPLGSYYTMYMNTIGSIDVLQKVSELKCSKKCSAENVPTGHFNKNFAAMSIHRRKDWCVTVKGFNRYNYDFENTQTKNVYGLFANYGALQISNSEAALKAYDVKEGWDWTRIPGATTIKPEILNRLVVTSSGFYNPAKFAGGMRFMGSRGGTPRNGIFAMSYKNPKYKAKDYDSALKKMQFQFKKSFFFYNDLIVCVGSDIKFKNADVKHYYPQTTLFQDKLVNPFKSSRIYVNGKPYDLRTLKKTQTSFGAVAVLIDTNGNIYQVKTPSAFGLNLKISDQESKMEDGRNITRARYATAWFKHKGEKGLLADKEQTPEVLNDDQIDGINLNRKGSNNLMRFLKPKQQIRSMKILPKHEKMRKNLPRKGITAKQADDNDNQNDKKVSKFGYEVEQEDNMENKSKNEDTSIISAKAIEAITSKKEKEKASSTDKMSSTKGDNNEDDANNYSPPVNNTETNESDIQMTNSSANQNQDQFTNNSTMALEGEEEEDHDSLYGNTNQDENENVNTYDESNDNGNDYSEQYNASDDDGMVGLGDESYSFFKGKDAAYRQKINANYNSGKLYESGDGDVLADDVRDPENISFEDDQMYGSGYMFIKKNNMSVSKKKYKTPSDEMYGDKNQSETIYSTTNQDDYHEEKNDDMYSSEYEILLPNSTVRKFHKKDYIHRPNRTSNEMYNTKNITATIYNGDGGDNNHGADNSEENDKMYSSENESFPPISSEKKQNFDPAKNFTSSKSQLNKRNRVLANLNAKKAAKMLMKRNSIALKPKSSWNGSSVNAIYNFLNIYKKISKLSLIKNLLKNAKSNTKLETACKAGLVCSKAQSLKTSETSHAGSDNVNVKVIDGKCKGDTKSCSNAKQDRRKGSCASTFTCKAEKSEEETRVKVSKTENQNNVDIMKEDKTLHDNKKKKKEKLATGGDAYQYAILVKNGIPTLLASYKVISGQGKMHMVNFKLLPDIPPINQVFAYSVFEGGASMTAGPVVSVSAPCLMMAEICEMPVPTVPSQLYLAINSPNIEYENDPSKQSDDRCKKTYKDDIADIFSPKNVEELSEKMKHCIKPKKAPDITVSLNIKIPIPQLEISIVKIMVDGEKAGSEYAKLDSADMTKVVFSNLINGLTTEVFIVYFQRPQ